MELLSINGLEQDLLLNSELYQRLESKSGKLQSKTLDKIVFCLNAIIKNNFYKFKYEYSRYEPTPVNTDILSRITGHKRKVKGKLQYYYIEYINELKRLGYIELVKDFLPLWKIQDENEKIKARNKANNENNPLISESEVTSRHYKLTEKAFKKGITFHTVLDASLINRIKEDKRNYTKNLVRTDTIAHKIVFNLCDVSFNLKELKRVSKERQERLKKQGRKEALEFDSHIVEGLKSISSKKTFKDNVNNPFWYYTSSREGRTFNWLTNTPSEYRKLVNYQGKPTDVIDMKSALPSLLILDILNKKAKTRTIDKEDFRIINDLSSGLFYENIYKHADTFGKTFLSTLYENNKPEFKKLTLSKIFDKKADKNNLKEMDLILRAEYPLLFNWMQETKEKEGYKFVSRCAQFLESELFIRRFFKHFEGWALPVHDSVIVENGKRDEARLLLARLLYRMFKDLFKSLKLGSEDLEALTTNFFRYE